MSEIKKLIERLCPDLPAGRQVEWKTMKDICILQRGKVYSKKYISDNVGDYPVYSSQTANNGILGKINSYDYDGNYLTWTTDGAYAGTIFYRTGKFSITNVCGLIKPKNKDINLRFLYYWLSLTAKKYVYQGMGNPKLMSNQVEEIEIPVPPIEVQSKIVDILDNFTELEAKLEAELEAELEARRKQYEYYRNQLLTFDKAEGARFERLGDVIVSLKTGLNPRKNFVLNEVGSNKPYITGKDIFANRINVTDKTDMINEIAVKLINRRACLESGLLLFASTGTGTVGRMAIIEQYNNDWAMSETLYAIKTKENLSSKYLMYFLYSENAKKQFEPKISKGSVPHLKVVDLLNVIVPIPPLSEQERIVSILDRFEALTTDLQSGLPAEIEARRKQYEYYREQLLTFKRKTA